MEVPFKNLNRDMFALPAGYFRENQSFILLNAISVFTGASNG